MPAACSASNALGALRGRAALCLVLDAGEEGHPFRDGEGEVVGARVLGVADGDGAAVLGDFDALVARR
jgi:hypothetical protein